MSMTLTPGLVACPPRFATPRDPGRETLGGQVAEVARRLRTPLMPHQQLVADVALEVEDGELVYSEIVMVIHRQSGKTTLVVAKTVNRMLTISRLYGPQRSTYVAQKRLDARRKLERDFAPALRRSSAFPELTNPRARPVRPTEWRLSLNNGSECIELGPDNYWQIGVPSESGGHGDTLDDATIDEARFLEDNEVEEGLLPSTITRRSPQLWVLSTPGRAKSYYLWRKVRSGRAAAESGDHGRVAYFEWSAPDDVNDVAGWGDPDVWRACMPALGRTITLERVQSLWESALRDGQEGIDSFRRSYLGQWPEVPTLLDERAAAAGDLDVARWAELADREADRGKSPVFAVAVSPDRAWATVAVAWRRADGSTHVGIVENAPTTAWVAERVASAVRKWRGKVVAAPDAADLVPTAEALTWSDERRAHAALDDAITAGSVRHDDDPDLNAAVAAVTWRASGDGRKFNRKTATDITPAHAAALALLAATSARPKAPILIVS